MSARRNGQGAHLHRDCPRFCSTLCENCSLGTGRIRSSGQLDERSEHRVGAAARHCGSGISVADALVANVSTCTCFPGEQCTLLMLCLGGPTARRKLPVRIDSGLTGSRGAEARETALRAAIVARSAEIRRRPWKRSDGVGGPRVHHGCQVRRGRPRSRWRGSSKTWAGRHGRHRSPNGRRGRKLAAPPHCVPGRIVRSRRCSGCCLRGCRSR